MVFSLSMLDVFCCALGCVTLLWLVNQRDAKLSARSNRGLAESVSLLKADLARAATDLDDQTAQVRMARADLAAATARAEQTAADLAAMKRIAGETGDKLVRADERIAALTREAADAGERLQAAAAQLKAVEGKRETADRRAADLSSRLADAESAVRALRESGRAASGRVSALEAELDIARRAAAHVDTEKKDLVDKLARARFAADNRFEGVALTGRRVLFLVDMSGSMELVDPATPAPAKWTGVRDTLLKVFRSIPDIEKFQVILFSDKLLFPLGNEGRWLEPDAKSAERLQIALTAVRPKGNTDLYAAFEAAFRYRDAGLDTIYLMSDGLPNVGEGLTADAAARMSETQRSETLSRVVRSALRSNWNLPQPGRPRVRINSIGFFYESPDVGAFLWALSRENDGSFVGMSRP
jgi:hypothetical protein